MATLTPVPDSGSNRGEQTKQLILSTALRLFREQGFGRTTMRAIATEAGVSVGNAYYYFSSKEHLMQVYYDQMQELHWAEAAKVLESRRSFADRLAGVLDAWVTVASPYHEFAGTFFKTAADPHSPLSPFSKESHPARESSIALYAEVLQGSGLRIGPELRKELPELLWLLQMGMVLFWVHDASAKQVRTRQLIKHAVPLVDRTLRLTRLPGVRGAVNDLIALLSTVRGESSRDG